MELLAPASYWMGRCVDLLIYRLAKKWIRIFPKMSAKQKSSLKSIDFDRSDTFRSQHIFRSIHLTSVMFHWTSVHARWKLGMLKGFLKIRLIIRVQSDNWIDSLLPNASFSVPHTDMADMLFNFPVCPHKQYAFPSHTSLVTEWEVNYCQPAAYFKV